MTEWQPIETAPKDGTLILVAYPNYRGASVTAARYGIGHATEDGYEWGFFDDDGEANAIKTAAPTNWMPLPQPPETDNET